METSGNCPGKLLKSRVAGANQNCRCVCVHQRCPTGLYSPATFMAVPCLFRVCANIVQRREVLHVLEIGSSLTPDVHQHTPPV